MAGVIDPKNVCSALKSPDQKAFCERSVQEQCVEKVDDLCIEMFPKDAKAAFKCYQDMNSGVALKNQTKKFVVELPTAKGKKFQAKDLKECGDVVRDKVIQFGVPQKPKPVAPPPPTQRPGQRPPAKTMPPSPKQAQAKPASANDPLAGAMKKDAKGTAPAKNDAIKGGKPQITKTASKVTARPVAATAAPAAPMTKDEAKKASANPAASTPRTIVIPKDKAAPQIVNPYQTKAEKKADGKVATNGARKEVAAAQKEEMRVEIGGQLSQENKVHLAKVFREQVLTKDRADKMAQIAKKHGASFIAFSARMTARQDGKGETSNTKLTVVHAMGNNAECTKEMTDAFSGSIDIKIDNKVASMLFSSPASPKKGKERVADINIMISLPQPAVKKAK